MWSFLIANRKILGLAVLVLAVISAIAILSVKVANLRTDNAVLSAKSREDSTRILTLERENIAFVADTTKYRSELRGFKDDLDRLKSIDKKLGKDLSAKYPTIDQIKHNDPR